MLKQQQMQWTPEGAHLLPQVRVQVIHEDWGAHSVVGGLPPTF
ncbi:hypothetical protein [Oscillochloris sp. ZM17-4]|nr:hypothetical protein [Oscillochloris sp. ZM17-4]